MSRYDDHFDEVAADGSVFADKSALDPLKGGLSVEIVDARWTRFTHRTGVTGYLSRIRPVHELPLFSVVAGSITFPITC